MAKSKSRSPWPKASSSGTSEKPNADAPPTKKPAKPSPASAKVHNWDWPDLSRPKRIRVLHGSRRTVPGWLRPGSQTSALPCRQRTDRCRAGNSIARTTGCVGGSGRRCRRTTTGASPQKRRAWPSSSAIGKLPRGLRSKSSLSPEVRSTNKTLCKSGTLIYIRLLESSS